MDTPGPASTREVDLLKEKGNQKIRDSEDFIGAIICYSQAIELDSDQYKLYNNRASAYLYMKEHQKALTDCEKSLHLEDNTRAHALQAAVLSEVGYLEDALHAVQRALALSPADTEAVDLEVYLTRTLEEAHSCIDDAKRRMEPHAELGEQEDFLGAIAAYTRAIDLYKANYRYYNRRAVAYFQSGEMQLGLQDCDASLDIHENTRAYCLKAAAYGELGQLDAGFECIARALLLSPEDTQSLKTQQDLSAMKALIDEGTGCSQQQPQQQQQQQSSNQQESEMGQNHASKYKHFNTLAADSIAAAEFEDAIEHCGRSLEVCENPQAYCLQATAYGELGLLNEGFECIDKALLLAPSSNPAVLQAQSDLLDIKTQVDEEINRQSKRQHLKRAQQCTTLADTCLADGLYQDAIDHCDESLHLLENAQAYFLKAKALGSLGCFEEALRVLSLSLDLAPGHAGAELLEAELVQRKSEADRQGQTQREEEKEEVCVADFGDEGFVRQQYASAGASAIRQEGDQDNEEEPEHEQCWEHSREAHAPEEPEPDEKEERVFRPQRPLPTYVPLFNEPGHEEASHSHSHSISSSRGGGGGGRSEEDCEDQEPDAPRRRSADSVLSHLPLLEDDGVRLHSMGITFSKLVTTPQALQVLEEGYSAVAHKYQHQVHDIVTTYNLPTCVENNLSGVVTGPINKRGQYPVFVEYPKHAHTASITRYYYPQNLWSKTRRVIKNDRVDHPDEKFTVVSGIYLHHQYHYDHIPAQLRVPLHFTYELGDDEDPEGTWDWSHDEIRHAIDKLKITQKTYIYAPEKYDNPVPEQRPYKITFLKVVQTLDT